MLIDDYKPCKYYFKKYNRDGSIVIGIIEKENDVETIGRVLFFNGKTPLESTFFTEKKNNMMASDYQFSKKGFVFPSIDYLYPH